MLIGGPGKRLAFPLPTRLRLVSEGRLDPRPFATHHFTHDQIVDAYGVFADAARTDALKMVLTRT